MKVCGGAAFRKELGIERRFRDARAARVDGAHHRRPARLRGPGHQRDGPAVSRPLLMGAVAYDPKVVTIWDGFRRWFADQGLDFDYVLYSHYERQVEDLVAGRIDAGVELPAGLGADPPAGARGPGRRHARHRPGPHLGPGGARRPRRSKQPADLAGGTVGTGAVDSPQGRLLPLGSA